MERIQAEYITGFFSMIQQKNFKIFFGYYKNRSQTIITLTISTLEYERMTAIKRRIPITQPKYYIHLCLPFSIKNSIKGNPAK